MCGRGVVWLLRSDSNSVVSFLCSSASLLCDPACLPGPCLYYVRLTAAGQHPSPVLGPCGASIVMYCSCVFRLYTGRMEALVDLSMCAGVV